MLTEISMFLPCAQWVFGPLSPVIVNRGAQRCGIQLVKQGCVEGIGSCVRGEILRDMWESMRERDRWSGQELLIWRTAGGKRIGGGISERSDPPA